MRDAREWIVAVAAVLAAIGTVAAFIVAFTQIADERKARKADQRKAATAERRAQAEQVSAWVSADGEEGVRFALANASGSPVYRAVVSRVLVQGAGPQTAKGVDYSEIEPSGSQRTLAVIPPGESHIMVPPGYAGMGRRPGVEIAFTDRRGRHWVRLATGALSEIHQGAVRLLRLSAPTRLGAPKARSLANGVH
jgi:hypothetical protein